MDASPDQNSTPPHGTQRPDLENPRRQTPPKSSSRSKQGRKKVIIDKALYSTLGFFGVIACSTSFVVALSAGSGVAVGQRDRNIMATATTVAGFDLQYELGVDDVSNGRYAIAAQRFRWIVDRAPDYQDAQLQLQQAERQITSGGFQPTAPPSDSDNPAELYAEAQVFAEEEEWVNVINRLEDLKLIDPTYEEDAVNELLFEALETLGLIYVRGERIEEGLFLLERASQIMPLSDQAEGERIVAELYSDVQIYVGLDWAKVVEAYAEIYDRAPDYRNIAAELKNASVEYGDELAAEGDYCDAANQYQFALNLYEILDEVVEQKYEDAADRCGGGPGILDDEDDAGFGSTQPPTGSSIPTPIQPN